MTHAYWPIVVSLMSALTYRYASARLDYEKSKRGIAIDEASRRAEIAEAMARVTQHEVQKLNEKLTAIQNRLGVQR